MFNVTHFNLQVLGAQILFVTLFNRTTDVYLPSSLNSETLIDCKNDVLMSFSCLDSDTVIEELSSTPKQNSFDFPDKMPAMHQFAFSFCFECLLMFKSHLDGSAAQAPMNTLM